MIFYDANSFIFTDGNTFIWTDVVLEPGIPLPANTDLFTAPTAAGTAQQMSDHLPQGRAWNAKNIDDSNVRKLINSVSIAHNSTQQQIQLMDKQFRIDQTTDLLIEWEKSVGLPSECSEGSYPTIEQRRQAVIEKFRREPIVTLAEFNLFIDDYLPDDDITLYAGLDYTGTSFLAAFPDPLDRVNFIVAEIAVEPEDSFAYAFQFPFGSGINIERLTCVMNKIMPSNILLLTYYA